MERDNRGLGWKISTVGSFMRVHDCNGDKTADSSGGCDFIESIVAPQYRLHLGIIYCTFKEKWLWNLFLKWEDCLGNQILFHANPIVHAEQFARKIWCLSSVLGFLTPPSLIN